MHFCSAGIQMNSKLSCFPATRPIYQPALHMLLQCKAWSVSPEEPEWSDLRALESVGWYFEEGGTACTVGRTVVARPLNRQTFIRDTFPDNALLTFSHHLIFHLQTPSRRDSQVATLNNMFEI